VSPWKAAACLPESTIPHPQASRPVAPPVLRQRDVRGAGLHLCSTQQKIFDKFVRKLLTSRLPAVDSLPSGRTKAGGTAMLPKGTP